MCGILKKVDYSQLKENTQLANNQITHLIDVVHNYFAWNELGLLSGKLELTDCGLPLSQHGQNYSLSVDDFNPYLKNGIKKLPTLEDLSINITDIKVKLPLREKINQILRMTRVEFERLKYKYMFSPKGNKRLGSAFLLHEGLHSRLEKHYFGDWKTFNPKSDDLDSAIALLQRGIDRTTNLKIQEEMQAIFTSLT